MAQKIIGATKADWIGDQWGGVAKDGQGYEASEVE